MKASLYFVDTPRHGKLFVTQNSEGLVVRYFIGDFIDEDPAIKIVEGHFFSEFANKAELKNFLNSIDF